MNQGNVQAMKPGNQVRKTNKQNWGNCRRTTNKIYTGQSVLVCHENIYFVFVRYKCVLYNLRTKNHWNAPKRVPFVAKINRSWPWKNR